MATPAEVTAEILTALPCFGLWVTKRQAETIATVYTEQRPNLTADALVEVLLAMPDLDWDQEEEYRVRKLIMRSLVEHLDGFYFVETREHDR